MMLGAARTSPARILSALRRRRFDARRGRGTYDARAGRVSAVVMGGDGNSAAAAPALALEGVSRDSKPSKTTTLRAAGAGAREYEMRPPSKAMRMQILILAAPYLAFLCAYIPPSAVHHPEHQHTVCAI